MCNEKNNTKIQTPEYDYRFIDYRLTQLEQNLRKGQEKLETDQTQNYKEILQALQALQKDNHTQNQTLTELKQRITQLEQNNNCFERIKEKTIEHNKEIKRLTERLDIYKQIIFLVGGTAVGGLITALLGLIIK